MYWKISDFTEEIKRVVEDGKLNRKTVDIWFKKLEEERVHYVNRTEDTNEKVYDELDLQLGIFIKRKRNENWSLNAIFTEIRDQFEVRPFPFEPYQIEEALPMPPTINHLQNIHLNRFKEDLLVEIRSAFEEVAASQLLDLKNQFESKLATIMNPAGQDKDERELRFQDMVLKRRVEYQLEKEALLLWTAKPVAERFKKVGLFRKEEDITKRDLFVKEFIHRHFAERMRKEIIFEEKLKEEDMPSVSV